MDQLENPENPSAAALAEAYAAHSASYYDLLRTSMIDDFLETKRQKPLLRRKPAKKSRPTAEKAATRAALESEAEATADEETSMHPEDQETLNLEAPPRAED